MNFKPDKTAMLYQTPNISTALQESSLLPYTKNVRREMTRQIVIFKPDKTAMLYQTPTFPQPDKSVLYSHIYDFKSDIIYALSDSIIPTVL